MRPRSSAALLALIAVAAVPSTARAQPADEAFPGHRARLGTDAAVVGVAAAGALLPMLLVDVDHDRRWQRELFGRLDHRVKRNFSTRAARLSDGLLVTTMVVPAALMLDDGLDAGARDRLVIYGEALLVNGMLASLAKYAVQRPRPYTYGDDPRARDGTDSRLSFYSGHAALAFGAAVSGSYIHAARTQDVDLRALMWGVELAGAAATANLRVRAGKHFYSDVVIGAVIGAGVGFLVPALHADDGAVHAPAGREYLAMGAGVLVGVLASELMPLERTVRVPLAGAAATPVALRVQPLTFADGVGLGALGTF